MCEDTESYPPIYIGQDLTYPSCGNPQDHCMGANQHTPWETGPVDQLTRCGECIKVNSMTHVLIVCCIIPASASLLMVLSAQGLNLSGIV